MVSFGNPNNVPDALYSTIPPVTLVIVILYLSPALKLMKSSAKILIVDSLIIGTPLMLSIISTTLLVSFGGVAVTVGVAVSVTVGVAVTVTVGVGDTVGDTVTFGPGSTVNMPFMGVAVPTLPVKLLNWIR